MLDPAKIVYWSPESDGYRRSNNPSGATISFTVPTVTAELGVAASFDMAPYYTPLIPVGETFQSIEIQEGMLPPGWALVGTSLDYDGLGPAASQSGIVLRVVTF